MGILKHFSFQLNLKIILSSMSTAPKCDFNWENVILEIMTLYQPVLSRNMTSLSLI